MRLLIVILASLVFSLSYDCSTADQAALGQQLSDCNGYKICEYLIKSFNCKLIIEERKVKSEKSSSL